MPDFETAHLSEIYENRAKRCNQQPGSPEGPELTHVKVKFLKTDTEEIIDPARMVWCPVPYELPCQSLFFSLLRYKDLAQQLNWAPSNEAGSFSLKLDSFKFVHLDNITKGGMGGEMSNAGPSMFN